MVECEVCGTSSPTESVSRLQTGEGNLVYVCRACVQSRKKEMGAEYQVSLEGDNFLLSSEEEEFDSD